MKLVIEILDEKYQTVLDDAYCGSLYVGLEEKL